MLLLCLCVFEGSVGIDFCICMRNLMFEWVFLSLLRIIFSVCCWFRLVRV